LNQKVIIFFSCDKSIKIYRRAYNKHNSSHNNIPEDKFSNMKYFDRFPRLLQFFSGCVCLLSIKTFSTPGYIVNSTKSKCVENIQVSWGIEYIGKSAEENISNEFASAIENSINDNRNDIKGYDSNNNPFINKKSVDISW
jgi:hypothetical protein